MATQKYLVRVVRPVFQAAYLEVEGRDESEACCIASQSAYGIPEEQWTGRFNPDDYGFDYHCVRSGETPEGHAFNLLDFPLYCILSTSPFGHSCGHALWMDDLNPMTVAAQMSQWIEQLTHSRGGYYEDGIENLEEMLREWKGTDRKVVPLLPPEDLRNNIEYVEAVLTLVRLLKDVD